MGKKRHKPEEIVAKLRQVDVMLSQGKTVAEAIRSLQFPRSANGGVFVTLRYTPRSPSHRLRAKGQHNQLTLLVDTLGSFQDLLNGDQDLPEVCVWRIQGHFLGINTYLKACKASTFRSRVVG